MNKLTTEQIDAYCVLMHLNNTERKKLIKTFEHAKPNSIVYCCLPKKNFSGKNWQLKFLSETIKNYLITVRCRKKNRTLSYSYDPHDAQSKCTCSNCSGYDKVNHDKNN